MIKYLCTHSLLVFFLLCVRHLSVFTGDTVVAAVAAVVAGHHRFVDIAAVNGDDNNR